jgi:glycine C-acetyltransferase
MPRSCRCPRTSHRFGYNRRVLPIITKNEVDEVPDATSRDWPALDPRAEDVQGLLKKNMGRFFPAHGPIAERNNQLLAWIQRRRATGLWPYGLCLLGRATTEARIKHPSGVVVEGLNFTTVDYLGLAKDRRLEDAAIGAIREFGVTAPTSGPLMGNSLASYDLERSVAKWLGRDDAFLCPTGWAAGFTAVSGIVRPDDYVVMDELSHQCLQQGAYASTPNVRTFRHLDNDDLETTLKAIRETEAHAAILVITEGLFSMDGDAPDLRGLTAICRRYGALVLVDIAHDLGATGPNGTGTIGEQGLLDEIDIIVGAFSKTCGTNGGFISSKALSIQWAQLCFGGPYTYSTALSPAQVAIARESVRILSSPEGDTLRAKLNENVSYVRAGATDRGLTLLGAPSAIVPILIGREQHSRLAGMLSFQKGLIAVCLEFPVVQRGAARFRLSMSPLFSQGQIDRALDIVAESIAEANAALE